MCKGGMRTSQYSIVHIKRYQVFSHINLCVYLHAPHGSGCPAVRSRSVLATATGRKPELSSLIVNRSLSESFVFPMVFQHFQQVVKLSSVDDQLHRALNCKCKSEDAGPWHGHGLEREWARPAARFGTKMYIFTRFLKRIIFCQW